MWRSVAHLRGDVSHRLTKLSERKSHPLVPLLTLFQNLSKFSGLLAVRPHNCSHIDSAAKIFPFFPPPKFAAGGGTF